MPKYDQFVFLWTVLSKFLTLKRYIFLTNDVIIFHRLTLKLLYLSYQIFLLVITLFR